jgi:hypothetical protein
MSPLGVQLGLIGANFVDDFRLQGGAHPRSLEPIEMSWPFFKRAPYLVEMTKLLTVERALSDIEGADEWFGPSFVQSL